MKYFLIFFLFLIVACSESTNPSGASVQKQAIVYWQGDYAVDGCGFFVEIDSKMYKPENENVLGDEYKSDNPSDVLINFEYLDHKINKACFDSRSQTEYDAIRIISIKKLSDQSIIGEWEWVESSGGIAGVTLIPETVGYTKTYDFNSDSTLSVYRNDTLVNKSGFHLKDDTLDIDGENIRQVVEFKTDRLILRDLCVDCFTNTYERKGVEPELLRIIGNWYTLHLKSDSVAIKDVNINGDIINITIGFSGCVGHEFELFAPSVFMESNPVQSRLGLYHKSSHDMCPEYTIKTISFNLIPLKEQYQEYYGEHGSIVLDISALGKDNAYEPKPTYEF